MSSQKVSQSYTTQQRWWQTKRVPLYVAVSSGLAGAALFLLTNRAQHPHVEHNPAIRKDPLPHEAPDAAEAGHRHRESSGRVLTREMGLHRNEPNEPQVSEGIFQNRKAADLIGGTVLEVKDRPIKTPKV